jgi:hypothetical protein
MAELVDATVVKPIRMGSEVVAHTSMLMAKTGVVN